MLGLSHAINQPDKKNGDGGSYCFTNNDQRGAKWKSTGAASNNLLEALQMKDIPNCPSLLLQCPSHLRNK